MIGAQGDWSPRQLERKAIGAQYVWSARCKEHKVIGAQGRYLESKMYGLQGDLSES